MITQDEILSNETIYSFTNGHVYRPKINENICKTLIIILTLLIYIMLPMFFGFHSK